MCAYMMTPEYKKIRESLNNAILSYKIAMAAHPNEEDEYLNCIDTLRHAIFVLSSENEKHEAKVTD